MNNTSFHVDAGKTGGMNILTDCAELKALSRSPEQMADINCRNDCYDKAYIEIRSAKCLPQKWVRGEKRLPGL